MVTEHLERETTYSATPELQLPDLTGIVPPGGRLDVAAHHLSSAYFDTSGRDLLVNRVTLRRRTGSTDTGWHLKLPASDDGTARHELGVPLTSGDEVPRELSDLVLGLRRGSPLVPLVTITTERTTHRIVDADGLLLVEIADDTVSAVAPEAGGARVSGWREIEAELGSAAPADLLRTIDAMLTRAGATESASPSKVATALGTPTRRRKLKKARTAGEVLRRYIAEQDADILTGELAIRRGENSIHHVRVATRRLRSTLRIFARHLDADRAQSLDADLSWFADLLGEVRDRDVQRSRFVESIAALPDEVVLGSVAEQIDAQLSAEEEQHRAALLDAMRGPRYLGMLQEVRLWATAPPVTKAAAGKPDVLAKDVRSAGKKVTKHLTAGIRSESDEELHKARKAGKRARYAAELAADVLGKKGVASVHRYKKLQDLLGEHQDAVVAAELLIRLANAAPTEMPTFTYGVLHERELARAAASVARARRWAKKHSR
ncbi:CYTH and CHAD domain-containing protein [Naasia lichenicola]|uniref:CYTH and CHAD domain-containing protein n=1 Tax=Naasia lichenicola TaxID=2565933 RepID=A0A4S4FRF6_9MICO|nr:CYTH and CHAD domain-containing protein [Naasia lichenicola]THG33223.1 CYTH and CHAD domain-containing protein [Naasia lichenicola]